MLRPESGIGLPALFFMACSAKSCQEKKMGGLVKIKIFSLDGAILALESHGRSKACVADDGLEL